MNQSLQTNDWKKSLQAFLKGSGKSLMKNFDNKTILVSLTGGNSNTHVVESNQVDSFMQSKGIKSVLQQHLQFKPTENQSIKAYFKEAPNKEKVNLIVFNFQEDMDQRNNLFILKQLHQTFEETPDIAKQALSQVYDEVQLSGSQIDQLNFKIGKILTEYGFPLAYLVLFADNKNILDQINQRCNYPQNHHYHEVNLKSQSKSPLICLLDELSQVDARDYCKVYQKYGLDHSKVSNLYQFVVIAQNPNYSEAHKKSINNLVMSFLKLDVNSPKMFIQNECGDHCQRKCIALTKFLHSYLN